MSRDGDFGHLKSYVTAVADDLRADFDQLLAQARERPPTGTLVYSIFGAIAEFERELIRERVVAGLHAAKRRGERLGRRPALTPSQRDLARRLLADG
jgi:DNA invertase Pin-like site-specific DNA recombinase